MTLIFSWHKTQPPRPAHLVPMALQLQTFSIDSKVPDADSEVIGGGGEHIGCQRVEAHGVDLFCVACQGGGVKLKIKKKIHVLRPPRHCVSIPSGEWV